MNLALGFIYYSPFPVLSSRSLAHQSLEQSTRMQTSSASILEVFIVRAEWSMERTWKPGPLGSESSPFRLSPLYRGQSPNAQGLSFLFCEVKGLPGAAVGGLDGD